MDDEELYDRMRGRSRHPERWADGIGPTGESPYERRRRESGFDMGTVVAWGIVVLFTLLAVTRNA